jgi:hypothetical protein
MGNNLTEGFKKLRKNGYFAKQNFWCCQTCGWSVVPEGRESKVVFYHNQDNESKRNGEPFHLCWSGDGHEIQRLLKECGVETEWNGKEETRIKVVSW